MNIYLALNIVLVDVSEIVLWKLESNCQQDVKRIKHFGVKGLERASIGCTR